MGPIPTYEYMEQFYEWNEHDIAIGEPHTSYLENSWVLKNSSSLSSLSPALRGSSTLLAVLVSFPKDCLCTCIFHSL